MESVVRTETTTSASQSRVPSFDQNRLPPVAGQTTLGGEGSHPFESADAGQELPHARVRLQSALRRQSPDDGGQNLRGVHRPPLSLQDEVMRRSLKHRVPPALPRNLVCGLDLTGKIDAAGKLHMILGLLDHGSQGLLDLAALPVSFFYNHVRPHQNLQGRTPAEVWSRVDPYAQPIKQEYWFEAWDGLLQDYYLRR